MPELSGDSSHPTLTVLEGRAENRPMIEGFARAAKQKGWNFCQLLGISSDRIARLDFDGIPLDYVIFRQVARNNYHETERLILWLKQNHKLCINAEVAGGRISTSDKHFQQGLFMLDPFLRKYALPTFEAKTKNNILSYIKSGEVNYPFVLKPRQGTSGKGIILIQKPEDLDSIRNFSNFLIQRYVDPECDWRVFVIGGTAVGVMRKLGDESNPDNFRAWSGGRTRFSEQDPATLEILSRIATHAAAVSRMEYAGVDIIKEKKTGNLYILETNVAAGWSNHFIPVTKVDIPLLVLDWFEDVDAGRSQPIATAVQSYIEKRLQYLPPSLSQDYTTILSGQTGIIDSYQDIFNYYPHTYLCDAGMIFTKLARAYRDFTETPDPDPVKYANLLQEIESMPLSWAGNFIGPDVGTLHDGVILSALYLFLLHKTTKI